MRQLELVAAAGAGSGGAWRRVHASSMAAAWISTPTGAPRRAFITELMREYYRHYAGLKDSFEIEPIYARHAGLFTRDAVQALRELDAGGSPKTATSTAAGADAARLRGRGLRRRGD